MVHKKLKIAIGAVLVLALGVGAFIIHQQANEREAANRKQASNIFLQSGKTSSSSKETPLRKQKKALVALALIRHNLQQTK